jgi:hypothetical protein
VEITFPGHHTAAPPPASIARAPAIARATAHAPRTLGGAAGASIARAPTGSSGAGGGSASDSVVQAVLRAMREENEHLGILDGIDPLF